MTQKQIDARVTTLREILARTERPQVRDRILREINLLEDKWMEIELAKSPEPALNWDHLDGVSDI